MTSEEAPELFSHLPSICNGRPLHTKLLSEGEKPSEAAVKMMARLISLSCSSQSTLSVIKYQFTGIFVHISPEVWCPQIPSKLYGNANGCYTFILEQWHKYLRSTSLPFTGDRNAVMHERKNDSFGASESDSRKGLTNSEGRNIIGNEIHVSRVCTQNTDTRPALVDSPRERRSRIDGMLSDTKNSSPVRSTTLRSSSSRTRQTQETRTSAISDPGCCDHTNTDMWYSCCHETPVRSRFRAARSFIGGHSDLDWSADDPRFAPSAGTLLLGRRVIAPKLGDHGRLYLATVISQIDESNFLINFEKPSQEPAHRENVQEVSVTELLSYLDLFRHTVERGDFVILPVSALNYKCENEEKQNISSDGPFMEPLYLGRVIEGREPRGVCRALTGTSSPVVVKLLESSDHLLSTQPHRVRPNQALWIPPSIVTHLQRRTHRSKIRGEPDNADDQLQSTATTTVTRISVPTDLPMNPNENLPPFSRGEKTISPIPVAHTAEEIERMARDLKDMYESSQRVSERSAPRTPASTSASSIQLEGRKIKCTSADRCKCVPAPFNEPVSRSEKRKGMRSDLFCCDFHDASTSTERKLLDNKKRRSDTRQSAKRPEWRYWGSKSIPNLLDPPSFEPFKDNRIWSSSIRIENVDTPTPISENQSQTTAQAYKILNSIRPTGENSVAFKSWSTRDVAVPKGDVSKPTNRKPPNPSLGRYVENRSEAFIRLGPSSPLKRKSTYQRSLRFPNYEKAELISPELRFSAPHRDDYWYTSHHDSAQIPTVLRDTNQNNMVQTASQSNPDIRYSQPVRKITYIRTQPLSQPINRNKVDSVGPALRDYHRERALDEMERQALIHGDVAETRIVRHLREDRQRAQ
ncbi:unnamed protein product [Calicophoron daubneyi]|uniref:Uncharacterized protein n=1 Tax=Calicophoron daubneyi TaxID=300641 RepID=A0AAV2TU27_CALDB